MNERIKRLVAQHRLGALMEEWRARLREPQRHGVLDHLVGFTGLDEDEVVFRCMRKEPPEFGARGWFHEEWHWADPCGPRETDWFYRASQCYLFSNARRDPWAEMLVDMGPKRGPVLEFGCGIGHNLKPLIEAGVGRVAFYEHSHVQHAFAQYRAVAWGYGIECHSAAPPGVDWSKHVKPATYNTVVLQDVLEHSLTHVQILDALVVALRPKGRIYERSPFTPPNMDRVATKKPFHVQADRPLGKLMRERGMRLVRKGKEGFNVWQKEG